MKREKLSGSKRSGYVLPTESAEQFESEYRAFESAIKPRDRIEQMHVEDVAHHNWKVSQRRRMIYAIFREALNEALYSLLSRLGLESSKSQILTSRWMMNETGAKAEVLEILEEHGLDEATIEAEAFARCSKQLAAVEQSEASHASRRDKALPNLAFYREMMARQSQRRTNGSLQDEGPMRVEHVQRREDSRGH